jgi:tRNA A37 methylthiotransferase MiaB
VGAWGQDKDDSIINLLNPITNYPVEIKMQEVNVKWLIKYLKEFEWILKTRKIKQMVVAFQSGNDRILKLMERGYTQKQLRELLDMLVKYNVVMRFHAILDFPSETLNEFGDTMQIIIDYPFRAGSIFKFQSRPNTKAFNMEQNNYQFHLDINIEGYKTTEQEDKYYLRRIK